MTSKSVHIMTVVAAILFSARLVSQANAQCCGTPTTAYYQPAAVTAYSPVAVQTVRTGWYPGYFLDRIRTRLFGSPSTYVAAYPTTYAASYPSSYVASYPSTYVASYPTQVASYQPTYSAGYATSYAPAASYAPATSYAAPAACATCPTYTASYAPACVSCAPCDPCACPTGATVSQTGYQQPGCPSCAPGTATGPSYGSPTETYGSAANGTGPTPAAPQRTYPQNGAPEIDPGANVPTQREQGVQRPATDDTLQNIQPEPADNDTNNGPEADPYKVNGDPSTFFQAPKLFDPNDRTAQRSVAPVTTALYQKPVSYRNVSAQRITPQQAERDAAGWVSASN